MVKTSDELQLQASHLAMYTVFFLARERSPLLVEAVIPSPCQVFTAAKQIHSLLLRKLPVSPQEGHKLSK